MAIFGKKPQHLDIPRAAASLSTFARREVTGENPYDSATNDAMRVVNDPWYAVRDQPDKAAAFFEDLLRVASEGGWSAVGVWRFAANKGPATWRADERLRSAFLTGINAALGGVDDQTIRYQADQIEEELIRESEPRTSPAWRIVPLRGMDMVESAAPQPGTEAPVRELDAGEQREVAHFGANRLVISSEDGTFVADLQNDGSGYRYASAATLLDLLRVIGAQIGGQGPSWVSPDLDSYVTRRPPAG
jgi:hypothetical protein